MGDLNKELGNSLFFDNVSKRIKDEEVLSIIGNFKNFSIHENKSVYITNKILGNKKAI